jgi:copper(I)-binding protein
VTGRRAVLRTFPTTSATTSRTTIGTGAVGIIVACALVGGCGSDQREFGADRAWARSTPASATNGVVYLEVTSDVDDSLVRVDVPLDVASRAELHTSDAASGGGHDHGAVDDGTVTMEQVEEVPIAADTTVEFIPGGNHIMLVDISRPLVVGDTFAVTLQFASGRTLEVPVDVADNPPTEG